MAITKREKRVKGQGGNPELLTFVIAAVILGLAVYFAFPYATGAVPKKRAVNAMKTAGKSIETAADNLIDVLSEKVSGKTVQNVKGTINLADQGEGNKNILSCLQTDTVYYEIQADWGKPEVHGIISWSPGSERFFSIHFYTDGFYLCFQVPELSEEIFKLDWGSNLSAEGRQNIEKIFEIVIGLNQEGSVQYYDKIKAAVEKSVSAFFRLTEKCSYIRMGTTMVYTDRQGMEAEMFEVTVPAAALEEELHIMVKGDIHFTLYIIEEKVVGLNLDLSQFDENISGGLYLCCLGETFFDDIGMEMTLYTNNNRIRMFIYSDIAQIYINDIESRWEKLDPDRLFFIFGQQTGPRDFSYIKFYTDPEDVFDQLEDVRILWKPKQGGRMEALSKWLRQFLPQDS